MLMPNLFRLSLSWQMAIATLLGIACGLLFGEYCSVFAPWGAAYIMVLKITAIPYLAAALIHGIGQLSSTQATQILKKGIVFIGIAWVINIAMVYTTAFVFPPSVAQPQGSYIAVETPALSFSDLLIPENIFYSLANNIVPSIVLFSILMGISLMHMKEKHSLMLTLETFIKSLTMITSWISRITPIGTFLIIANQAGTIELSTIQQVSTYIILYILALCLVTFWIFPRLVSTLTPIPALQWIRFLLPILLLAYTTNLVIVCLPYIIALIERETQLLHPHDEKAQNQIQGTVSIIFNLPLGSLFITLFVLFISVFYQHRLDFAAHVKLLVTTFLTSLGSVGIGSWVNSLTFLLDTLALPIDAIDLFITTIPFTSGFQTMVSAMEITSLALFVTLACRKALKLKWSRVIRSSLITVIPIIALYAAIKIFRPFPDFYSTSKTIFDLGPRTDVITQVATSQEPVKAIRPSQDSFDRILRTKTLRVGYSTNVLPYAFLNKQGKLAGHDIAFAYQLAYDLGCALELVPLNYGNLTQELNSGVYDVAMSAISMTEMRLKNLSFTRPYMESKYAFVVRDNLRKQFASLDQIKANHKLKIAVLKGSAFEPVVHRLFPHHRIVAIDTYDEFAKGDVADALFWAESQAIAWALIHPHFSAVFPDPSMGTDSLSFAVANDSIRLLNYLNEWLQLKKNEGFTDRQYDIWVLGKTETEEDKPPRWSIIRNVLHWTN
jgi:Na+/H+-dicarboxylate symporter/ABC-type amino acid transport substrate-binding protein